MGIIFTDAIAREMGITNSKVQGIANKIGIIVIPYSGSGGNYISDSDAPKLKIAIKIVEKDQTLLENVPKLKITVQIVEKDQTLLENVPKLKIAIKLVEAGFDFNDEDFLTYANSIYDSQPLLNRYGFDLDNQNNTIKSINYIYIYLFTNYEVSEKQAYQIYKTIHEDEPFLSENFAIYSKYEILIDSEIEKIYETEVIEFAKKYGKDNKQTKQLAEKYELDFKAIVKKFNETNLLETLKAENEKLKAELDLIEKDKLATAEIIKRIGEKYF
jgi:hypothetical protein